MRPFPRAVTTSYLFITAVFIIIIINSTTNIIIIIKSTDYCNLVSAYIHRSDGFFCMITFCFSVADADVTGDFVR